MSYPAGVVHQVVGQKQRRIQQQNNTIAKQSKTIAQKNDKISSQKATITKLAERTAQQAKRINDLQKQNQLSSKPAARPKASPTQTSTAAVPAKKAAQPSKAVIPAKKAHAVQPLSSKAVGRPTPAGPKQTPQHQFLKDIGRQIAGKGSGNTVNIFVKGDLVLNKMGR